MANLFGLPSPQEVRAAQNQRLFGSLPRYGGPQAGAMQGASAIGAALGSFLGGESGAEKKAQSIQEIAQRVQGEFPGEVQGVQGISQVGNRLAEELLKAGHSKEAFGIMGQLKALIPEGGTEFKKEERGAARKVISALDKTAASLRGDFGKLKQLSKRAKGKGTSARAARNSMIANIVKLNSPGIVSEQELKTYTGGQGTTSAFIQWARGKGYNMDAIEAQIDPSGEGFDVDGMLGLGSDLILGQSAPIFDQYDDAISRAERAGLSKRARDTHFKGNKNIEELRKLAKPKKATKRVVDW